MADPDLREGLLHGAGLASVLAAFTPLWDVLVQTAGIWFPLVGVVTGPIARNIPAIPTSLATQLLVVAAALYGATLLDRLFDRLEADT
jgi:hypothetical protein